MAYVLVGGSIAVRELEQDIDLAARSNARVLITGELGVGKEVIARLLHKSGSRESGPFVAVNCAAFPEALLESELFGDFAVFPAAAPRHTGGWLDVAHGGSILLEDIDAMSLPAQALLQRFLGAGPQESVPNRTGRIPDVRVIAATHRRLFEAVNAQRFSEELYYQLNVVHIEVPPLRERRSDIPALLVHLLGVFADTHRRPVPEVTQEAMSALVQYHWPGNLRELRDVAERLILASPGTRVRVEDLPFEAGRDRRAVPRPGMIAATLRGPATVTTIPPATVSEKTRIRRS